MTSATRTRQPPSHARFFVAAGLTFLAMVLASQIAQRQFGSGFLPHGYCFTWIPGLLWLNVISDALIALAYLSIPMTLLHFVRRRTDLPFSWVFLLFGIFIVACGTTHALDVWTVWHPDYWLAGGVKALTAAASVTTAVVLVGLIPKALAIPSSQQLLAANDALHEEIAARRVAEGRLEESKAELKRAVAQRTKDLAQTSALLDAFFESSPLGLAVFDDQLRYVRLNASVAEVSGLTIEQHWGRTLDEVSPDLDPVVNEALKHVRDGKANVIQIEITGTTAGSTEPRHWRMLFHKVPRTADKPLIGYVCETLPH